MVPILVILRGISGSGKSSVEDNHTFVLSSDKFRELVCGNAINQRNNKQAFDALRTVLDNRMRQGAFTIIDATNLRYKECQDYIAMADEHNVKSYVVSINRDVNMCIHSVRRRAANGGLDIPEEHIRRQHKKYNNNTATFRNKLGDRFIEVDDYREAKDKIFGLMESYVLDLQYEVPNDEDVWCIGDVHACNEEFEELILKCKEVSNSRKKRYKFIQLGDAIDRGPSLEKTFDVIVKHNVQMLLGNHESAFLSELNGRKVNSSAREQSHIEYQALSSEKQKVIYDIITNAKFCYKLIYKDRAVNLCHSGLDAAFARSHANCFPCKGDFIANSSPITEHEAADVSQVYGHRSWEFTTPEEEIARGYATCIDAHCFAGGQLMAFNPGTKEYLTVDAKKVYYQYDTPR